MHPELPKAFTQSLHSLLGEAESQALIAALASDAPVSIQRNPYKPSEAEQELEGVPWYEGGYYLPERPSFTLDPFFQAGAYYVQEASSMFVGWLAQQSMPADRPWKILDLCAAPGGKSCLLAAVAPPGSLLVSNEVIKSRYSILKYNLAKWGLDNCWTINFDPEKLSGLAGFFDLVLVDAPCSGEGMFRKDPAAIKEWSEENVAICALRQERILSAALPLVAPGGRILYTTCTYNVKENEEQASFIAGQAGFSLLQTSVEAKWKILQQSNGYRFLPHRTRGEGFYALAAGRSNEQATNTKYRRKRPGHWTPASPTEVEAAGNYLEQPDAYEIYRDKAGMLHALNKQWLEAAEIMVHALGRIDFGFPVGQLKGNQLVPSAELALHTARKKDLPSYAVNKLTALQLLKKDTPPLPDLPKGWHLITYQGLGLLWVKGLDKRYNNYYPPAWRIRMKID